MNFVVLYSNKYVALPTLTPNLLLWFSIFWEKEIIISEELESEKEKREVELQQLERQASIEKQQVYEDAFLEQMNYYIQHGKTEGKLLRFKDWYPLGNLRKTERAA